MRDGIRLHTFLFKPELPGKKSVPVILQRSCYVSHREILEVHGAELAKRGYGFCLSVLPGD